MILEANGIRINVQPADRSFTYQVFDQSQEATDILRHLKVIGDEGSSYTLRSNKRPSYNTERQRFFLRGNEVEKDRKVVRVDCNTQREADRAIEALRRLIGKVVRPAILSGQDVRVQNLQYTPGGTAHLRFRFINREMAQFLKLTGKDHYPIKKLGWVTTEPVFTYNTHYNEHIAQGIDVLNKSINNPVTTEGIINPHKVTPQQARAAVELLETCFDKAYREDFFVAWWRIVTAVRGPDFIACPTCGKEC